MCLSLLCLQSRIKVVDRPYNVRHAIGARILLETLAHSHRSVSACQEGRRFVFRLFMLALPTSVLSVACSVWILPVSGIASASSLHSRSLCDADFANVTVYMPPSDQPLQHCCCQTHTQRVQRRAKTGPGKYFGFPALTLKRRAFPP